MTDALSLPINPLAPKTTIAIIAPGGLQHALSVMLRVISGVTLVASEISVAALHQRLAQQPLDLILLDSDPDIQAACGQVRQIKAYWPSACSIVLIEYVNQHSLVKQAGATVVLPKGVAPDRLVQAISAERRAQSAE